MENSSKWPVQKGGEASARQLQTLCLGRVTCHYCTPLASFDFRAAFGVAVRGKTSIIPSTSESHSPCFFSDILVVSYTLSSDRACLAASAPVV
jgi:hypothetical protein